jgi:aminopeptidase N
MLKLWRDGIIRRRAEPIPIWLGHRVATAKTGEDYSTIVYEKGAWTLHMLRILLLDMKTMNEDKFTEVMRTYYTTFRGRTASTDDFQRVVEQKTGQKMDWFFEQWVRGSAVPTYKVANRIDEANGKFQVKLRVTQEEVPESFLAYVPVAVELDNKQVLRFRVKVTGAKSEIALPTLDQKPKAVRFNDMEGILAEVKSEGW